MPIEVQCPGCATFFPAANCLELREAYDLAEEGAKANCPTCGKQWEKDTVGVKIPSPGGLIL